MSVLTVIIINIAAAGVLSAILSAVMLVPGRHLRPSHQRDVARRNQDTQSPQVWALRPEHAS